MLQCTPCSVVLLNPITQLDCCEIITSNEKKEKDWRKVTKRNPNLYAIFFSILSDSHFYQFIPEIVTLVQFWQSQFIWADSLTRWKSYFIYRTKQLIKKSIWWSFSFRRVKKCFPYLVQLFLKLSGWKPLVKPIQNHYFGQFSLSRKNPPLILTSSK